MANAKTINAINISRVLRYLWHNPAKSRTEIAESLGLDKSTITKIISVLEAQNLIVAVSEGTSGPKGGRKPIFLSINPEFGVVMGIEIHTTTFTAVLVDLGGNIVYSKDDKLADGEGLNAVLIKTIQSVLRDAKDRNLRVLGIGIGLSGLINPYKGLIIRSNPLDITEPVSIRSDLEKYFEMPVFIENDANCCCWADLTFNRGEKTGNAMFILSEFRQTSTHKLPYQGVAIGMGYIINNRVIHGDSFSTGEFKSILWKHPNNSQFSITDEEIKKIPDPNVLEAVILELAVHVAFIVNNIDIRRIVICGELEKYKEDMEKVFLREIQHNWTYPNQTHAVIEMSPMREKTVAYGAAGFFIEHLFRVPEISPTEDNLPAGIELFEPMFKEKEE
ncbi:ROK family transcriptional regulator [Spirochaetia bacterium 38H-sp]|uniref:ROK family transcriptional regulator n=1 Tax=Rarispira pelagica TaxID=3141764 RepID=A0ABU9UCG3_9SPIR